MLRRKIALFVLLPFICLTLLFLTDKALQNFYSAEKQQVFENNFVLPANSSAFYKGPEFSYLAKTNSLGFRGREYPKPKAVNTIRILAVGDSFTFGAGSNEKDIWTTQLEKVLGRRFMEKKVEIFNLGQPGLNPYKYLEIINKYVPLYDPDILLLGIVEGDDIGQLIIYPEKKASLNQKSDNIRKKLLEKIDHSSGIRGGFSGRTVKLGNFLAGMYPFFYSLLTPYKVIDIRSANLSSLKAFINYLGDEEIISIETRISSDLLDLYLSGGLNPNLLSLAVSKPDFFTAFMDENDQKVNYAVEQFTAIINEVDAIAKENGTLPLIIDIPYGLFVSKGHADTLAKMGFRYSESPWLSEQPLSLLQKGASPSGMRIIDNLHYFREKCSDDCFFKYDGHFNGKGNKLLADNLGEILSQYIKNNF